MTNEPSGYAKRKHLVPFLIVFFVLVLGIGIGTLISYRTEAEGPGDSQLQIQRGAAPVAGESVLSLSKAFVKVAQRVEPAVVNINTEEIVRLSGRSGSRNDPMQDFFHRFFPDSPRQFTRRSLGSGVIVDPKGYIITNNHVIEGASKIKVNLAGGQEYMARVIAADSLSDIAVIKIDRQEEFPYAKIGDSKGMNVGDWVIAIGSPFGLEQTVTAGIVSATGRVFPDLQSGPMLFNDYLQTDAAINPGNSGGPLVNMNGEVVGINSFIQTGSQSNAGVGFAVPSHIFVNVYNQILNHGEVKRGWLGVNMNLLPFTPAMAKYFGVQQGSGVLITGLTTEEGLGGAASPAAKAGINPEDVIVEFNGKKTYTVQDLRLAVANTPPGKEVEVKVVRHGTEKTFSVTLGERPPLEAQAENRGGYSFEEKAKPKQEIGLEFDDVPARMAHELDITGGALVTTVTPGGLADDAGLQGQDSSGAGDVIVEANGRKIETARDLYNVVQTVKSGEGIVIKFLRPARGQNGGITTLTYFTSFVRP